MKTARTSARLCRKEATNDRLRDPLVDTQSPVGITGFDIAGRLGVWALQKAPLDALPDLSDVQVIVRATYPGKAPQVIED